MKFLSDILAKAGLTVDGVVTLNNTATGQTPATNDNSTKLATTAFIKNQSYLSANQTITVSGDATGSGTTSIILTLANSGVTAGVYGNASNIPTITVDAKGRITSISTNAVSIITTLAGLSDVTLTSPSANQVLQYNGTQWVNGAAPTTYTLPIATSSILGGIKVGTGLSIDAATGILTVSGGGGNLNYRTIQEFTSTSGQTTYTISGGYAVGYVEVFVNGVYISENQYTATNGSTIVLTDPNTTGDVVTVFLYSLYNLGASIYARNVDTLTATAGQTSFTTSYIPGQIDVYYNGSKLTAAEYTATTGASIVLGQAAVSGDIIEVVTYLAGAGLNASRTLTINGTTYDLTANRTWTLTTANISEVTNLYYTDARARAAISVTGSGSYNSSTGVITVTGGVTSVNTLTGAVVLTTTNIAEGTNLYYTTARANADFDTRLATKSTSNLTEGSNLYYTDARVGTYLTTNSYATQTYVGTQIANLVASAPATLDTLNELALALGNDPSFATTVATSIGTKVPQTRTITINGTAYDLSADRSWTIASGVTSFNTRTGAITAASGDYTTAQVTESGNLYYTDTRVRAAISLTTTGTSGAATYDSATGIFNIPQYQGGVTSFNTRTGAITLSSSDVTTALTYTPVTNARTLTINGTTYDLTADRSWSIASGVTSFNTRTGAISLTSLDVTDALTYIPVTNARTITINGTSYDLSANRSWTIAPDVSVRNTYAFTATAAQTTFTVSGGYTVGLVDVFINGVKLAAADFTATNGTTVVLGTGTGVGNIVEIVKYVSAFTTAVETTRTLTINGTTYDLSANRTWSIDNASLGAQAVLNGTGLVRMSGTTVSYDNATYATQSYVTTAVANLVNSAPSTLDTLNELATALGNDANFATTVTTSIGTKQAQLNGTGFVKITGTTISYDNSTYLTTASASSTYQTILTNPVTGTGTTNYLPKFTGTSTIGNSLVSATSAIVTIESAAANYAQLQLNGVAGYGSQLKLGEATGGYGAAIMYNVNVGTGIEFYSGGVGSGGLVGYWSSTGLGIGSTSNGGYRLQVTGTTNLTGALSGTSAVFSSSVDAGGDITATNTQNGTSTIRLNNTNSGSSANARLLLVSDSGNAQIKAVSSTNVTYVVGDAMVLNADTMSGGMLFAHNDSVKMTLNTSGNVGIGVTPSAWSGFTALQVKNSSLSTTGSDVFLNANCFFNGSNWRYIASAAASQYYQDAGSSIWRIAPSGTAGNAITFTQAMTLFANGNLAVGTATDSGYKLDVNGTGRFSGSGSNGYLYVSGNAGSGGSTNPAYVQGMNFSWNKSNGGGESLITYTGAGGGSNIRFGIGYWNNTTYAEQFTIASTGAATFSSSVTATSFNLGNGQFLRLTRNSGALQYDALGIVSGTDNTRLISTGDFDVVNGSLTSQFKIASTGAATFSGPTVIIGSAVAATNVKLLLNGVASKAAGIEFHQSGTPQWYIGNGIASEDNNFELYNSNGTMAMKIIKSTNAINFIGAATFVNNVSIHKLNTNVIIGSSLVAGNIASNMPSAPAYILLVDLNVAAGFSLSGKVNAASYTCWNVSDVYIRKDYSSLSGQAVITGVAKSGCDFSVVDITYNSGRYIALRFTNNPEIDVLWTGYRLTDQISNGSFQVITSGVTVNSTYASY